MKWKFDFFILTHTNVDVWKLEKYYVGENKYFDNKQCYKNNRHIKNKKAWRVTFGSKRTFEEHIYKPSGK